MFKPTTLLPIPIPCPSTTWPCELVEAENSDFNFPIVFCIFNILLSAWLSLDDQHRHFRWKQQTLLILEETWKKQE